MQFLWVRAALIGALIAPTANAACSLTTVDVRGSGGQSRFTVEVADDAAERGQGLMFRENLGRFEGMLFVYDRPQRAAFWMRNTLIPLDMIFTDRTGKVTHVHANAVPLSEALIEGGDDVFAVLEVNGGLSKTLSIEPGAVLRHPVFGEAAAWPCD
jgi:uncharacterized membrane protein (UPF0127 family)